MMILGAGLDTSANRADGLYIDTAPARLILATV